MADQETSSKSLPSKYRRLIALTVLAIFTVIIVWDLMPYFEYRANAYRIRQLISIGSNIDDAGPILRKNGFTFYDKHFSTAAEDTYWIDVYVANKPRPWTLTLLHLYGFRLYFHWIVIESGLDNKVRKIF
ncbi:MAG: hypothetical protein MUC43_14805 [Pirellula sp.]|jgi:hypothetical protein|nr:hypothetical protein [Pirellula sp.]